MVFKHDQNTQPTVFTAVTNLSMVRRNNYQTSKICSNKLSSLLMTDLNKHSIELFIKDYS